MGIDHLFSGSAVSAVDASGGLCLPDFVRGVIERRSDARSVMFAAHESDTCLTGYDQGYGPVLQADIERRRLREEAAGGRPFEAHHARARRAFGLVEPAAFDRQGRIVLPPMMRSLGKIERIALFVGTGGTFEIWNPHLARDGEDTGLSARAEYRLGEDLAAEGRS